MALVIAELQGEITGNIVVRQGNGEIALRLIQVQGTVECTLIHIGQACALVPPEAGAIGPVGAVLRVAVKVVQNTLGYIVCRPGIVHHVVEREGELFQISGGEVCGAAPVRELVIEFILL